MRLCPGCTFGLGLLLAWSAHAVQFDTVPLADTTATVIRVHLPQDRLELFLDDETAQPFLRLGRLADWLQRRGRRLVFGMNAGMYTEDHRPLGLYIADLAEAVPLNQRKGWGNFYLAPNGVFAITPGGARVLETGDYSRMRAPVVLATQSGPMLVRNNQIHPNFKVASPSKFVRNGVGVAAKDEVVFAISEGPVTFHAFAMMFRDRLHCPNALYLDGSVSSLFAPSLGRDDSLKDLGPMIGVVESPLSRPPPSVNPP